MQEEEPPGSHDPVAPPKIPPSPPEYTSFAIVSQNKKAAVLLIIAQLALIGVYGAFIRPQSTTPSSFGQSYEFATITPIALLATVGTSYLKQPFRYRLQW